MKYLKPGLHCKHKTILIFKNLDNRQIHFPFENMVIAEKICCFLKLQCYESCLLANLFTANLFTEIHSLKGLIFADRNFLYDYFLRPCFYVANLSTKKSKCSRLRYLVPRDLYSKKNFRNLFVQSLIASFLS